MKQQSKLLFAASLALALFFTACNKEDDNINNINTPNAVDINFINQAAYANNNKINFAHLALNKSANDSVKMFAQMMIDDHTNAKAALDSIATQGSFNNLPDSIDQMHQVMRMQLDSLNGRSFDTAYINGQVRDHQQTVSLFQTEISSGNASYIKAYAQRLLPQLQEHLQRADSISRHL